MNPRSRTEKNITGRVETVYKSLQKLTKDSMPDERREVLFPLMQNLAWQKVKLEDARSDLMSASLFVAYDNGGGQTGIREHPGFSAYNKLMATYNRGLKQLLDAMRPESAAADELVDYIRESVG